MLFSAPTRWSGGRFMASISWDRVGDGLGWHAQKPADAPAPPSRPIAAVSTHRVVALHCQQWLRYVPQPLLCYTAERMLIVKSRKMVGDKRRKRDTWK